MLHIDVFKKYKKIFFRDSLNVKVWHPNGFNSIRIRLSNDDEWVFTYVSDRKWSMETLDNFIETLIKNKNNGGNENEI